MEKTRYAIEYSEKVLVEQLPLITKVIRARIKKAIEEKLTVAPLEFGKPLRHEWGSHRRLRVGDYRIIYKVIQEKVIVFIVEIDHRKNIYKS